MDGDVGLVKNDFEYHESVTTLGKSLGTSSEEGKERDEDEEEESWEEFEETKDSKEDETLKTTRDTTTDSTRITKERLEEIQRELCLVELCWPEIDTRKDLYLRTLPSSYYTVNGKEKLLAWYAENFRQQFHTKYPDRKPLLLMSANECGVQKFVSTTIRRSTLPYPELYTWQGCGKFVSDYIEYESLDKALSMPERIHSPTWLTNFQKGNSFECATFLTSLLLGQGYNAFVASGYASREQTLCDTTRKPCPYLRPPEEPPPPPKRIDTSKYKLKPPPSLRSQFLLELEADEEERMEEEEEGLQMIQEFEYPTEDEYRGRRIHAWVVILPEFKGAREREILEPVFIETSSGEFYKPSHRETNELYHGVESIWNDRNYWVNVQPPADGCSMINWDLSKTTNWEHLLPGEPWTMRGIFEEVDEEISIQQEKHLDMPSSYVNEINISSLGFERRYPNGRKKVFYKKTKVELYAPYVQTDGMIERVTVYDDYDYSNPVEVYEKYINRSDNLVECKKNLLDDSVIDLYKRGRSDQVKEHRYFASGGDAVDSERILNFYHVARLDGLSRIEMHPTYLTQFYENRDDFLYHRHVQYSTERDTSTLKDIHFRRILKITEKYHRDKTIPASKNIAIREFAMSENEIRLTFHYNPEQYSRGTRTYIKPPLADRGERLTLNPSMIREYNPDPVNEPVKSLDVFYELDKQLKEEDKSISEARLGVDEVHTFLKTRSTEYTSPVILVSTFDTHRAVESELDVSSKDEKIQAESRQDITKEVDYLSPYLARIGNPSEISRAHAYLLQEDCLNDYKQLLVRRANNILRKFEEYMQEYEKLQVALTQSEDLTREEEESLLEKTNEISFQLHTLEVRLNRHRDLASKRYKMLQDHLRRHPTLLVLQRKPS